MSCDIAQVADRAITPPRRRLRRCLLHHVSSEIASELIFAVSNTATHVGTYSPDPCKCRCVAVIDTWHSNSMTSCTSWPASRANSAVVWPTHVRRERRDDLGRKPSLLSEPAQ